MDKAGAVPAGAWSHRRGPTGATAEIASGDVPSSLCALQGVMARPRRGAGRQWRQSYPLIRNPLLRATAVVCGTTVAHDETA